MMKRLALAAFVVATAWGAVAHAGDEFTRRYQAGIDAYRLGDYAAARTHLQAARDLRPTWPGPHRFLAAVAAADAAWEECVAAAREAIAANPRSSEIDATRKLHDDCRRELGRPAFTGTFGDGGAIYVVANVVGASVSIGGLKYGATPLGPRPLAGGEVVVTVERAGWRSARVSTRVLPGIVTDVQVELREATSATSGRWPNAMARLGFAARSDAELSLDGAAASARWLVRAAIAAASWCFESERAAR